MVQSIELYSHFPRAIASPWFKGVLGHLEGFRLGNGRYCFPRAYLQEKKQGYYVGGSYMGLEEDRKTPKALELESTFRYLLLMKNCRSASNRQ